MYDRRLDIEEKLFYAGMTLQQIQWGVTKENQATIILNQIENLQKELALIKDDVQKVELIMESNNAS